ncbi:MAG: virulence protein [Bacteroidales bacterium]|nr:virulence protein [Alloprevotella sp.]MBR1643940.1 virulence protein [Bacteroidales bacterium]
MYAIAFDLVVKALQENYGENYTRAYYDVKAVLRKYGFFNVQGSVYIQYPLQQNADGSDASMPNLYLAINALKSLPWFSACVRDIRVFRVENWSDMTSIVKQ